ncbi:transcription factor HES-2-like [Sarcophilus harrisii]
MEKRRRAHINESLSQLKGLILPLIGKDSSHYSKLEKADILEMMGRFLQELPTSHGPVAPTLADSYREGYWACLSRLTRVLPSWTVRCAANFLEHLHRSASGQYLPPDSHSSPKNLRSASPDRMWMVCSPQGSGSCPPGPPPSGLWHPW